MLKLKNCSEETIQYFEDNLSSLNWTWKEWEKFTGHNAKTLREYAKGRGILKRMVLSSNRFKTKWTEEKEKLLIRFYNDYTIKELEEVLGLTDWCIYDKLSSLGLKRNASTKFHKIDFTEEFKKDLFNPYLSNEELGRDYSVSASCIAIYRKKLGIHMKGKSFWHLRPSTLEIETMAFLEEQDLAYVYKKILKLPKRWEIDFYLGKKLCVEVNSVGTHQKDVLEKDARKVKDLIDNGYKILYIADFDFLHNEKFLIKFNNFLASSNSDVG